MPDEQPISQQPAESEGAAAPQTLVHEPLAEPGDWLPEEEELTARPRRRLLAPLPLSLLGVLLVACGFIGGVLVEKGQGSGAASSSAGSGAGLAARFAALRGGSGGGSTPSSAGASLSARSTGSGGPGGAGGATVGQVSFISNGTLYVATAEGNTVKVTPSPGATVTKTVKSDVKGIHPGETVIVTGAASATGAISAESIRASASVAGGGGLGALLGGGAGSGGGGGSAGAAGGKSGSGAGGGPVLFGPGG